MAGKWLQPFPSEADQGVLELHSTASEPWLDVEIANASKSIARIRQVDLKLGKRLEIQLRLAQQMACLLAPRFSGQHIKMQLHDEDPGVGCLRMDAPVGADLESSPLIPDPYCLGTNGYEGFPQAITHQPTSCMARSAPCGVLARFNDGKQKHHHQKPGMQPPLSAMSSQPLEPSRVDARFNQVVQCLNDDNRTDVREQLRQQGLMGATVGPWHASLHAWLIDIDGNVNSWGLLWKLPLRVLCAPCGSNRQQWFHKRMVPWRHMVPIAPTSATCVSEFTGASTTVSAVNPIAAAGQQLGQSNP